MKNKDQGYKKNSIDFFDRMAEKNHGDSYKHYKTVLSWIDLQKNQRILDLGCGKGELLEKIYELNSQSHLFGVDISPKMIEKAQQKNTEINFSIGDSENLNFPDNYFELITCLNSFHHYENPEKSIKEMFRVLNSNGTLILGEIYLFELFRGLINKTLPYGNTGDFKIYSPYEIKKIFSENSFKFIKEKYIFPSLKVYFFKKSLATGIFTS